MAHFSNSIIWLQDVAKYSPALVGQKAADLGLFYTQRLPVPSGFVISNEVFQSFLLENDILQDILFHLKKEKDLAKAAEAIQKLIFQSPMNALLQEDIIEAYEALAVDPRVRKTKLKDIIVQQQGLPLVSVRSSIISSDKKLLDAGLLANYFDLKGKDKVIASVKACWASLFTERALHYRMKHKVPHKDVSTAVVVQQMITGDRAGTVRRKDADFYIEAGYGKGKDVHENSKNTDSFTLDLRFELKDRKTKETTPCLSNYELRKLAELYLQVEQAKEGAQVMDFIFVKEKPYVMRSKAFVQAKAKKKKEKKKKVSLLHTLLDDLERRNAKLLVSGVSISPGKAKGKVSIVRSIEDFSKVKEGDVIVARTAPKDVHTILGRASAVIIDSAKAEDVSLHSLEMNKPCIVDAEVAVSKLEDGQFVTIDGDKGKVYDGDVTL